MAVEFLILGPLEIRHEGRTLDLGGTRRRALIAALLLRAPEPVTADWLIQALWGEEAAPNAANALQAHVSRVRRDLGPVASRLQTEPGGYRLVVLPDELDAARLARGYEDGRALLAAERPADAAETLRAALALWRGPVLGDLGYEPFAQADVRRLEELHLQALEERLEADLALGEHALLAGELDALVAANPLRERLRGQQMLVLYRLGRHAEALASYRDLRERLDRELGLAPGPELHELEQAILTHQVGGRPVPVPEALTPTFGREDDLHRIGVLVERADVRLLTLTGPGGVGKTRLALEVARASGGRFVSLASVSDAEQVAPAICDALDVSRVPGEPAEDALHRALAGARTPVVLDNLEHLPAAAPVISRLLASAPELTVVGTSRQPLGLLAEHRYPVAALAAPAAAALFESRARARGVTLAGDDRPAVADICERLGGLPLAIELAAGRLGVLDPAGLAARLGDTLGLLGPGPSDAPARQRTLRATLDWSYTLLEPVERDAFTALGAVAGGCDLSAAEVVTGAPLPVLDALVDKGLVSAAGGRLAMLEPVRQYAAERLAERADADSVHARHQAHYVALAERTRRDLWLRGRASPAFDAVHAERDNFRAALDWGIGAGSGAVRLAGALHYYWWASDAEQEARAWYARALSIAGETTAAPEHLARARLGWSSFLTFWAPEAVAQGSAALALYRRLGDERGIAETLLRLGSAEMMNDRRQPAFALAEQALEHARAAGDDALAGEVQTRMAIASGDLEVGLPLMEAGIAALQREGGVGRIPGALSTIAFGALALGAYDEAEQLLVGAEAAAAVSRSGYLIALVHGNRGLAALLSERHDDAREAFAAELRVAHAETLVTFYMEGLFGFAALAAHDGRPELAAALEAAAWDHNDRPVSASEQPVYDRIDARYLAPARERLGAVEWERAAAGGRGLTAADALALALG